MSTLASSSTDAEVLAAYDDNASYEEDESTAKAAAFITACRFLLRRMARKSGDGTVEAELSPDLVRDELKAAQSWLAANGQTGGGALYADLSIYRD